MLKRISDLELRPDYKSLNERPLVWAEFGEHLVFQLEEIPPGTSLVVPS